MGPHVHPVENVYGCPATFSMAPATLFLHQFRLPFRAFYRESSTKNGLGVRSEFVACGQRMHTGAGAVSGVVDVPAERFGSCFYC